MYNPPQNNPTHSTDLLTIPLQVYYYILSACQGISLAPQKESFKKRQTFSEPQNQTELNLFLRLWSFP